MSWPYRSFSCSLCIGVLASLAGALPQQTRKLNAPLALGPAGVIDEYRVTPDGTRVVYVSDQRLDGFLELFVVPLDGSEPSRRLNAASGEVSGFEIAPDGDRVVFVAQDAVAELYSVALDVVVPPVKLNAPLAAGGTSEGVIAGGSGLVVYSARQESASRTDVYAVPIDGSGAPVRLNETTTSVESFRVTPDGERVVFVSGDVHVVPVDGSESPTQVTSFSGGEGLFSSSILETGSNQAAAIVYDGDLHCALSRIALDGSGVTPLSAPISYEFFLESSLWFEVSPDGAWILYLDPFTADLYAFSSDGSPGVQLNTPPMNVEPGAEFTPEGNRVVYRAYSPHRLFSVLLGPSPSPVQLSLAGGNGVTSFQQNAVGTAVVYVADHQVVGKYELWRVPVDGSTAAVKLNGSMLATRDVYDGPLFAPGNRVVFRSDKEVDERIDLWAVPEDASAAPVKLDGLLDPGRDVQSFLVGASHAVFAADIESDEAFGLHGVPLDASLPPVWLTESVLQTVGDVESWAASPDGRFVIYEAAHDPSGANGLARAQVLRPGPAIVLDVGAPIAHPPVVSPDAARVVYRTQPVGDESELYSVPAHLGAPPVKLNGTLMGSSNGVTSFQVAPDSSRVAYRSHETVTNVLDVYSIAVDGSGSRVRLTPLGNGRTTRTYGITSDSTRVVYIANQNSSASFELFSVPIGGGVPLELHAPLLSHADVGGGFSVLPQTFELSPDGERVVYLCDRDSDEIVELYSTPADGSATEVELNAALVANGMVERFRISPDSSRVVYVADQAVWHEYELYGVDITGGTVVHLSLALPISADVVESDVQFSPDSIRVVFRAGNEYFRVPADGSASPVRVSDPLVPGRSASSGKVSPNGAWFVFLADRDTDEKRELYSVPLLGGTTRKLNLALPAAGDVSEFSISPDGTRVAYRADQAQDEVMELFSAPIDGSRPARRESGPLVLGGDVDSTFAFTPGGHAVLYQADQERDGVVELFLRYQGKLATGKL